MSLWFLIALMTAASAFAVLWPLGRRPAAVAAGADAAVYRDQLQEVDRDYQAGLIDTRAAEAARTEIGRRLLAAIDTGEGVAPPASRQGPRRVVAVVAMTVLPVAAVGLYAHLGSPTQPAAPLEARKSEPMQQRSVESLVAQVEAHLAANPEDGRGWEVLAPVYLRMGRFDDAVRARRNALRLNGASPAREADLGEALVYAANGLVTDEARGAFDRAIALDRSEPKARYFLGLAAEQDGRLAEAAQIWRALLAEAPAEAGWLGLVRTAIARVEGASAPAAGPTPADMAEAEKLPPEERAAMVRGMVERLAARLRENGSDVDGWVRLVQAYLVLGEPERAKQAAADGRKALAGDPDKLRRIDDLLKGLGLDT
jgi:cytochrome c-type biogenesis protein CcmH